MATPATKPAPVKGPAPNLPANKALSGVVLSEQRPDYLPEEGNLGNENVGASDLIIPRLELVQALSPARKKGDPQYIAGAEEGMLYNSLTRKLYGATALIIPVYYRMEYMVWLHRKAGGGFRGSFMTAKEAQDRLQRVFKEERPQYTDDKKQVVENAAEVIDTPQHFALVIDGDGKVEQIVVSMPRTKNKVSRKFNSLIRMAGGDRFSRVYEFSTAVEQNADGQDYHNFQIKMLGYPVQEIYERAKVDYEMIQRGNVRASTDGLEPDGGDHGSTEM